MSTRRDLVEDIYPLSPLQEGLLFHTLYTPNLRFYFQQLRYTFRGEVDRDALREAWRLVVERHQPLRTGFLWERRDRPLQIVHRRVEIPWEELAFPSVHWSLRQWQTMQGRPLGLPAMNPPEDPRGTRPLAQPPGL